MVQVREKTTVRRKQIVSAARKLIVRYGSEHVTVRRIAQEIGVSEGAIYRHFKSKRDVLSFLIEDIENTLLSDIDKNYTPGLDVLEALEKVAIEHISAIQQRKGVVTQVIAEIVSLGEKGLNRKVSATINKYISRIKDILAEGVKSGAINPELDMEATAILFFGMTQGLVNIWALNQYSFDLQERYESLWRIFREAIIPH